MPRHVREPQVGGPVSLRLRLISLVVIVPAVSLVFGGAIACFSASRSVRTEMLSALVVAQQPIENAIDGLQTSHDSKKSRQTPAGPGRSGPADVASSTRATDGFRHIS